MRERDLLLELARKVHGACSEALVVGTRSTSREPLDELRDLLHAHGWTAEHVQLLWERRQRRRGAR